MPRQLTLAAADVEHRRQPLVKEPAGHALVDIGREGVLAQHRTSQAKALGPAVVVRGNGLRGLAAHPDDCRVSGRAGAAAVRIIEVRVRKAETSDARATAGVHVRAWQAAYRGLLPDELLDRLSVEERERNWRELLGEASGRSFTLVAVDDADVVQGFCALATPSRDDDADERTAEVAATYVEPGRWRVGVGAALLDAALAELRRAGYEQATLWVFAANEGARLFYRSFGFEPDGRDARHDWSGGQHL